MALNQLLCVINKKKKKKKKKKTLVLMDQRTAGSHVNHKVVLKI